ncbi:MAG TPA: isocitrate/isopropylmalate dehydrogenase family protein [Armatimonadota bacterium]
MAHSVTLIPGDGIGPEVIEAARQVVAAAGVDVHWHEAEAGAGVVAKYGTPMPDATLNRIREDRVALKGPLTTPIGYGFGSPNVTLRKALDLYVCLRPVSSLPLVPSRYEDVDLIVVRENTEGLYSGVEHLVVPGIAESLKITTEVASVRIAEYTFELARKLGRKRVTSVHKANIMKITDGLFLECCRRVARRYPEVEYQEEIIDALCMKLVKDPTQFDMLLTDNLYGDIVSDLCAGLVGGLGVVPGANLGREWAVFEAVHGSAPDIAGKGMANPLAVILSACMMLEHLEEDAAARRVRDAVTRALGSGVATRDLGGTATTQEFTQAVIAAL